MKQLVLNLALLSAAASAAVVLDAPGHAAPEGAAVAARGGEPGAAWHIVDWLGRDTGLGGVFDGRGEAALPPLPAGYWRMVAGSGRFVETPLPDADGNASESGGAAAPRRPAKPLATLAVVAPSCRTPPCGVAGPPHRGAEEGAFFAADAALSSISRPGAFLCPWNGGDTARTVADLLALAGFGHVRDRLHWRHVQPSPDAPPNFGRYLANAQTLRARGIGVSGMFHDSPAWADPGSGRLPRDLPALYRFCREAAAAFGDCVEDWEFWNEPDLAFAPEPVWDYAAAFKVAALAFKATQPGIAVLNGALALPPQNSPYHDAFLANGTAPYFDVFNYHTYAPAAKHPEIFRQVREKLAVAGAADKPVWVTEFGTELEGLPENDGAMEGRKAHSPAQELVHAEACVKSYLSLQREGVERAFFFVFGAYDERGGLKDWGVIRRDGTVKPVFAAMAALNRELGDARFVGAVETPPGIRASLYERADGSQTVAFWSESPVDAVRDGVVSAEPLFARKWVLRGGTAAPAEVKAPFRLTDMCGGVSTAPAPGADGTVALAATRYPAYLSGLRGLRAAAAADADLRNSDALCGCGAAAADRAAAGSHAAAWHGSVANQSAAPDLSIVLRIQPDRADFEISGRKTVAVLKGDAGRARIEAWNFSDTAKTGTVAAVGATVSGLPSAPFAIAPLSCAAFDCTVSQEPGSASARASVPNPVLVLSGDFNGRPTTPLAMPLLFAKSLELSYTRIALPWRDPALWRRNSSGDDDATAYDEAAGAIRFDASWADSAADRWLYPERGLGPGESLDGAILVEFEIRSAQDKVENDFKSQYLMLVYGDGRPDAHIPFDAPTDAWERRRVILPPGLDLPAVKALRIGANPRGMRCAIWIRDLGILK